MWVPGAKAETSWGTARALTTKPSPDPQLPPSEIASLLAAHALTLP